MYFIKIFLITVTVSGLFSSCDLFNSDDDIASGKVVWQLENQTETLVGTQPLIRNSKVYFLQDGFLKAYNLDDGNKVWSIRVAQQSGGDYGRKLVQSANNIFLDQGYNIKAFSTSNGFLDWNTRVTDNGEDVSGIGSPIMSQDKDYLYAGRDGYVLKLRKDNGQNVMRYPLDRLVPEGVTQGATEPIISPFGDNILYVPTSYYDRTTPGEEEFGANMFAFNSASGEIIWETRVEYAIDDTRTEMSGDSVVVSPPIYDIEVTESSIVALQGKAIVVLDRFNGDIRWYRNFPDSGFDVGLAVEGDAIYAASVGNYAYRLNLQDGEVLWERNITFANTSIPTVQNGRMYFTNSGGGDIWVLDTQDGSVIFNERPPNYVNDDFDVYISSLGVGEGYMVNIGSKAVYCLTVP